MIKYEEAERMPYLPYKRLMWSRLVTFWEELKARQPDWATMCDARLTVCRAESEHWNRMT